jgi:hypothetical protein
MGFAGNSASLASAALALTDNLVGDTAGPRLPPDAAVPPPGRNAWKGQLQLIGRWAHRPCGGALYHLRVCR